MRLRKAAFIWVGLTLSAFAQRDIETRADVTLPDGRRNLVISNHTGRAITALAYQSTVAAPRGQAVDDFFYDSLLFRMEKSIGPHAELGIPAGPASRGGIIPVIKVEFRAALFDDGTAFGDPAWIARLRDRRVVAIEALDDQISVLEDARADAANGEITREALIGRIDSKLAERRRGLTDSGSLQVLGAMHNMGPLNLENNKAKPLADGLKATLKFMLSERNRIAAGAGIPERRPAR